MPDPTAPTTQIDDGGPAFAQTLTECDGVLYHSAEKIQGLEGMSLRDYFAAKAMQAYLAADTERPDGRIAELSYATADSMLEARGAK